jgi:hypothetical protein
MQQIREIFEKEYELRSPLEHQFTIDLLSEAHSASISVDKPKLLSLLATPLQSESS